MKRLNRLLICAIAGTLVTTVSCGEDSSSPVDLNPADTATFNLVTGCSGTCVGGFVTMVDGFHEIIRWLAVGKDTAYADRSLNLTTGDFGFDLDMDGDSKKEMQVRGVISPLLHACDLGMLDRVNKVCVAEWDMLHAPTADTLGSGTFSIVFLGMVGSPETPSFRVTIVTEEPWMETVDGCRLEISGLQLMLHPFRDPNLVSATVSFRITSEKRADSKVIGDLIYGYDPSATSQSMSMTGKYEDAGKIRDYSCTMDLDTRQVDCSIS